MLSLDIKSKINSLWEKFWSRGISNPITAIEQISYLLFMRRLDDADTVANTKANENRRAHRSVFAGKEDCRWTNFSRLPPVQMLRVVSKKAFPFIKKLNHPTAPYARHMENAVFIIKNAQLLDDAVKEIDDIFSEIKKQQDQGQQFQDTLGDVYEYLINEIGTSGKNGQFRSPRHIIQFICELIDPSYTDTICDPACGTGGFLVGAYQYILTDHTSKEELIEDENGLMRFKRFGGDQIENPRIWSKLNRKTFYGFDVDQTMVRIGLMNLMLHGIETPNIENIDTLSQRYDVTYSDNQFSIVMANPPFTGKIDKVGMSKTLGSLGNQSELLFLARISRMLKRGGRAAVIVPEGVLFGSNKSQKAVREMLLRDNSLEGVVSLPSGVFKPYTGVKTAILLFTKVKENSTEFGTKKVWFFELVNDGFSLDDSRRKLVENPLPSAVEAWRQRGKLGVENAHRVNNFFVPIEEIISNNFNLSFQKYREAEVVLQLQRQPAEILAALFQLERNIQEEMRELEKQLS